MRVLHYATTFLLRSKSQLRRRTIPMPRNFQQHCCAYNAPVAIFRLPLSTNHLLRTVFCLLLSAFCLTTSSYAQSATATLSGTVEDPKGAVVPGASIALINATQVSQRLATTNSEGAF